MKLRTKNINATDPNGLTPIFTFSYTNGPIKRAEEILSLLIDNGLNINFKNPIDGDTCLIYTTKNDGHAEYLYFQEFK